MEGLQPSALPDQYIPYLRCAPTPYLELFATQPTTRSWSRNRTVRGVPDAIHRAATSAHFMGGRSFTTLQSTSRGYDLFATLLPIITSRIRYLLPSQDWTDAQYRISYQEPP